MNTKVLVFVYIVGLLSTASFVDARNRACEHSKPILAVIFPAALWPFVVPIGAVRINFVKAEGLKCSIQ